MMIKKQMKIFATTALAFSMTLIAGQQAIAAETMPDMDHSTMPGMDHSQMGHDTSAPSAARDPHANSGGYSLDAMASHGMADQAYFGGLLLDRLEAVQSRDDSFQAYDLQGWYGKDYNKLVLKAEGEVNEGKLSEARTELLWGHALTTYWDTQLGLRYNNGIAPSRKWLAAGVRGLAPYWFEIDATAYLGKQGRTALRLSAEYELLLTQKLILQPRIEANFYGKPDAASELGAGLSDLSTGLRLRYEICREFAPYLGVEWSGKHGGTADYARAAGERTTETRLVAGVRFWY